MEKLKVDLWTDWLTEERRSRWNHIRHRSGLEDITREQGARILATLVLEKKDEELNSIKARIAE